MLKRFMLVAGVLAACAFCVLGCGDDVTAPTPHTPINKLEFREFDVDSLRVTFSTTVLYARAELRVSRPGGEFSEVEEIVGTSPKEFRVRWTDHFDAGVGGYVMVRIYYGTNESIQYSWSKEFRPPA